MTVARPDVADAPIWAGVANLGRRPTINDGRVSQLEVHVFDFDGDLYGQTLEVSFHTLLREERKFENFAALAAQIGAMPRQRGPFSPHGALRDNPVAGR